MSSIRLIAVVGALGIAAVLLPTTANADPAVSLTPTSAGPYDSYVFSGSGFPTSSVLKVAYTGPSGSQYTLKDSYGADTVVKVGNDGAWELRLLPGNVFSSTSTGLYHVAFCQPDGGACWSADLTITRDVPSMGGMGGMGGGGY